MSEMAAAVGRVSLVNFPEQQNARFARCYEIWHAISHLEWLDVPWSPVGVVPVFFWLPIYVNRPVDVGRLRDHLLSCGVETRYRYDRPLYEQPVLREYYGERYVEEQAAACPTAQHVAGRYVGLPTLPDLMNDETQRIIDAVRSFEP